MIIEVLNSIESRVTQAANRDLDQPFSASKVSTTLSLMSPLKSPGREGFSVVFFHKYWSILGSNVIAGILDFLNNHRLPRVLNYTHVVLSPKLNPLPRSLITGP